MSQVSKAELYTASFEITAKHEEHGFDRRPEEAFDLDREPVMITGVYMTGDAEDPPLNQVGLLREDLARPGIQSALFVHAASELALKNLPFIPDQEMKGICKQIAEAVDEMEEPSEGGGFAIIALYAIYNVHNHPIPHTFVSRKFVDVLSKKTELPTPTEDEMRRLYSIQAEHNSDIEPFEEYVAAIEEVLAQAGSDEQANRVLAENYLNFLVVPRTDMHPVIASALFSER
ncbi:MAG TPA: hypothetical protein VFX86_01810 [Candidatus Saccharimonadales bacterium]|nr:hypothetical protein [Candidatus Saccharimonadales bacterium]